MRREDPIGMMFIERYLLYLAELKEKQYKKMLQEQKKRRLRRR